VLVVYNDAILYPSEVNLLLDGWELDYRESAIATVSHSAIDRRIDHVTVNSRQ
jgi:hypothetical protein